MEKTTYGAINSVATDLQNKDAEQDTAIAGKVAIDQGANNAGKALVIGADGNVTPGTVGFNPTPNFNASLTDYIEMINNNDVYTINIKKRFGIQYIIVESPGTCKAMGLVIIEPMSMVSSFPQNVEVGICSYGSVVWKINMYSLTVQYANHIVTKLTNLGPFRDNAGYPEFGYILYDL